MQMTSYASAMLDDIIKPSYFSAPPLQPPVT